MPAFVYQFGSFRLDCGRYELLSGDRAIKLERKPMELLILLASRDGQLVTRTEIAKHLWESDVFVDTEHGINTAVRKVRGALGDDSENPSFIQTVPGVGYRFVTAVVTEVPTEPPLPSVPTEAFADNAPPSIRPRRHAIQFAVIAVLAIVIILVVGSRSVLARLIHRDPAIRSLAVLPLDNLSGDSSQDYFADGITDELTTMLARNSTLRVTSRTSAMQFKGAHRSLSEIARALNVDAIVEGSVTRTDSGAHMTIQLIRADTDTHLWAQSYDRSHNGIPALPDDAARDISAYLHKTVASPAPTRFVNPEAHDAYLHGRYLWFADQIDVAGEYFKKAVALQPDYALGWTGVADYYGKGTLGGYLDPRSSLAPGLAAAARAIQLDGTLPQAHLSLCAQILIVQWDPIRADQECRIAIQLDPKLVEAYFFRAMILAALNRNAEAIEVQKHAVELDPIARPFAMAYVYQLARQYDAGITDARQRLVAAPEDPRLHWILFTLYRCKKMKKEWITEAEKTYTLSGDRASAEGIRKAYATGGYNAAIRWEIVALENKSKTSYVSPLFLAVRYGELGNREKTLAFLDQALEQRSTRLLFMQSEPAYDFLHADPHYKSILSRVGLPPADSFHGLNRNWFAGKR